MSDTLGAPKLFISYRRDETPVSAAWLYEVLAERFGESNVFMDLKLKPGENFVKRISEVVGSCHILLLVMGPRWASPEDGDGAASIKDPDDFVRLEAEIAMARDDVQVLPVLVGGAKMPHPDELPDKIREITEIHAKQLTNERRAGDMTELVGRVEELLPPETTVHRVPPPPAPPRRAGWKIVAAAAAAVALVAVGLIVTGALSGDGGHSGASAEVSYPVDFDVGDLDARGDMVALTKKQEGSGSVLARLDLTDRRVKDLDGEPASYQGMDVGTDAQGHELVVASRCDGDDCDVNRLRPGDAPAPLQLSSTTCQPVNPSMDGGRVLFSFRGEACETRGLYLTDRSAQNEEQIFPGATRGADLNGSVAAALLGPRTLALWDMTDADEGMSREIDVEEGHRLLGPLVVDGDHVYFVDSAGGSFWIARIDVSADPPVMAHYVPAEGAGPAPSAPRFGVTAARLYSTGLPRSDGTVADRVIVRDDDLDSDFTEVDGAVTEL